MKVLSKREYTDEDGNRKMEVILDDRPKIVYDVVIDEDGKKLKRRFLGYTETTLIEPSQWYTDNLIKPSQEAGERMREDEEKNVKIALKMREMAIKELEKEGEL